MIFGRRDFHEMWKRKPGGTGLPGGGSGADHAGRMRRSGQAGWGLNVFAGESFQETALARGELGLD